MECSVQIVDFFTQQPEFIARTQVEQLDRLDELGNVARLRGHRFLQRLRFGLKRTYDNLNVFGLQLPKNESSYELSSAFVNLSLSRSGDMNLPKDRSFERAVQIEDLLGGDNRVLIEGPAGAGKTTLIHAIALLALDASLPENGLPSHFAEAVPFVLTLRMFSHQDGFRGPRPEQFIEHVAPELDGEKPEGWVSEVLRTRSALVLIDGLDEVRQEQRRDAVSWMNKMIDYYDQATYIITSRPAAVDADTRELLSRRQFAPITVQPMTTKQIALFVDRWHESKGAQGGESLKRALSRRRDLHNLASTPLLCAMMCALHYVNSDYLPRGRVALYEDALTMLLERRDRVQNIEITSLQLDRHQSQPLLSCLAIWMVLNEQRTIAKSVAIEQLANRLPSIRGVNLDGKAALQYLLERSGLLQEPSIDYVEFRHPSFQDFLAATEIIRNNYIPFLVNRAEDPLYQDVAIMAVGRAQDDPQRQRELLTKLIDRADSDQANSRNLWLLAAASISDLGVVDEDIASRIEAETAQVVPPDNVLEASQLAAAGEFVLDLVADRLASGHVEPRHVVPCVHLASTFDTSNSMALLAEFIDMGSEETVAAIVDSWRFSSDPQRYADQVLADAPLQHVTVTVEDARLFPLLERLANLTRLNIMCNLLVEDTERIARLNGLTHLQISTSQVDNLGLLARLPNLQALSLTGQLHSQLADALPHFSQLEVLHLNSCHTSTLLPASSLTNLRHLRAPRCSVANITHIDNLSDLRVLDLSVNPVVDLAPVRACRQLEELNLAGTRVADLSPISGLENLSRLFLTDIRIRECGELTKLGNLKVLSLAGTRRPRSPPTAGP